MTTRHCINKLRERIATGTEQSNDAGFTLIEVIVSFIVFSIVAASAATAIFRAINASHVTQQRVGAAGVAQSIIANAIAQANANTAAPEQGKTILSGLGNGQSASKEEFIAVRTITFDSGGDTCAPGTLFTVNVMVKQAQTGQFLARSDTKIACPPA
jgi:prepilin-type N-terminal cleavage/methylation domain-containing protein